MATNKNFGKLADGKLTYAQTWVELDGRIIINPTDAQYASSGWLKISALTPSPESGYHVSGSHWEERDGQILKVWEYAKDEPTYRVFSKLYLILALKKRGLYDAFKAAVAAAGLEDEWVAANELNEGYEGFAGYRSQMVSALGITDAVCEEILSEAVAR